MSKCTRNVLLIFGYLLIMAILFVPYEGAYYTPIRIGIMFTPIFIYNYIRTSGYEYGVRFDVLITEVGIILVLAGFAYILFCVVLRKSEKRKEG